MSNEKKKVVILGAGPSGLALAYELLKKSDKFEPIIIEKLDCVGGLSRTVYFDKLGVDIGGHRLYTNDEYIKKIWLDFLPEQNAPSIDDIEARRFMEYPSIGANPQECDDVMLIRKRFSSIIYNDKFFDYPLKISFETFKKLGLKNSFFAGLSYFKSIFVKKEEKTLEDFLINRFGKVLYQIFFKEYTRKVWGVEASELSCDWGKERIRKLSLLSVVFNALFGKFLSKKAKMTSLIDEFYYPKFGCSQLWNLMADYILANGGKIIYNSEFVDFIQREDNLISVKYKNNSTQEISEINASYYASSIPLVELIKGINLSYGAKQYALNLPYRDYILVGFYTKDFNLKNKTNFKTVNNITPECWIYLQQKNAIASRIQIMNNWSPYLVEDFKKKYLISLEYFTSETEDLWNMDDDSILQLAKTECEKFNLFSSSDVLKTIVIREKKAYPSYYGSYSHLNIVKSELNKINNLYLIGRNGMHKYNNMDEAMLSGIQAARDIIKKVK